ncbi:MAG: hypoxanthine phosphoribosyltransferase [Planctomycetes bacterium]|nr:hypoxanthine phosphoribosyltransferase [Planctomycetota bacterium]
MQSDIARVLIDRAAIAKRVEELGRLITADIARDGGNGPAEITLVPILTGSIVFVADLVRHLPIMAQIRLISVSSYPGAATASKDAHIREDLDTLPRSLRGAHVLVIDDILDSGRTLRLVTDLIREKEPATLRTCVLLRKRRPEAMEFSVDYTGFDIPDEFVVGFGLDYNDYYRNLPDIVTLRPEAIRRGLAQDHAKPGGAA